MIFSHIIEEKNNIKIEILEEAKFMIEHDFQMMNPGSHVTSCFWWFVQALIVQHLTPAIPVGGGRGYKWLVHYPL